MEELLNIIVPLAEKYGPEIVGDVVAAFKKSGYTVQQIDDVFGQVKPYDQLGINANAPVKPEILPAGALAGGLDAIAPPTT